MKILSFLQISINVFLHLVLGCLCRVVPAAHSCYLGRRKRFPIRPLATPDRVDHMFAELWCAIPRPPWREHHCQAWISPEIWSLIGTSIEARRRKYQRSSRELIRAINSGIQEVRCRRSTKTGSTVDSLLVSDPPLIRES